MAATFQLDTSGAVEWPDGEVVRWDRLSPFAQGYVEALFAGLYGAICPTRDDADLRREDDHGGYVRKVTVQLESGKFSQRRPVWKWGGWHVRDANGWMVLARLRLAGSRWTYRSAYGPWFRRLSPEALALILRDVRARAETGPVGSGPEDGRAFWEQRQRREWRTFPPLTPYLSDEGRVCLREAGQ